MTLRSGSADGPTAKGSSCSPRTTNEEVASKPIPTNFVRRSDGARARLLHGETDGIPDLGNRLLDDGRRRAVNRDVVPPRAKHPAVEIEDAGPHAARAHVDA